MSQLRWPNNDLERIETISWLERQNNSFPSLFAKSVQGDLRLLYFYFLFLLVHANVFVHIHDVVQALKYIFTLLFNSFPSQSLKCGLV